MTLQDSCICFALFLGRATKVHGPCGITCAVTILASRIVQVWCFLVYEEVIALEGGIMWEGGIGPSRRNILIGKTHVVLRLASEFRESPRGLPLGNLETLGHLLLEPGEELHITSAVADISTFEPLNLDFVLDALHLFNDRRRDGVSVVRQHERNSV